MARTTSTGSTILSAMTRARMTLPLFAFRTRMMESSAPASMASPGTVTSMPCVRATMVTGALRRTNIDCASQLFRTASPGRMLRRVVMPRMSAGSETASGDAVTSWRANSRSTSASTRPDGSAAAATSMLAETAARAMNSWRHPSFPGQVAENRMRLNCRVSVASTSSACLHDGNVLLADTTFTSNTGSTQPARDACSDRMRLASRSTWDVASETGAAGQAATANNSATKVASLAGLVLTMDATLACTPRSGEVIDSEDKHEH